MVYSCITPISASIIMWLLSLCLCVSPIYIVIPVVDATGDGSKVQYCKEQYCLGIWNVRSMNQGKLEVAKQEMVRVNINILGIRELKWTGMDDFNSDDHYIYYYGKNPLRNGVAIIVNKRVQNAVLGCNLQNDRMISVRF